MVPVSGAAKAVNSVCVGLVGLSVHALPFTAHSSS